MATAINAGPPGRPRVSIAGPPRRLGVPASHDRTLKVCDLDAFAWSSPTAATSPYISIAATPAALVAGDEHGTVWFLDWPRQSASDDDTRAG